MPRRLLLCPGLYGSRYVSYGTIILYRVGVCALVCVGDKNKKESSYDNNCTIKSIRIGSVVGRARHGMAICLWREEGSPARRRFSNTLWYLRYGTDSHRHITHTLSTLGMFFSRHHFKNIARCWITVGYSAYSLEVEA